MIKKITDALALGAVVGLAVAVLWLMHGAYKDTMQALAFVKQECVAVGGVLMDTSSGYRCISKKGVRK